MVYVCSELWKSRAADYRIKIHQAAFVLHSGAGCRELLAANLLCATFRLNSRMNTTPSNMFTSPLIERRVKLLTRLLTNGAYTEGELSRLINCWNVAVGSNSSSSAGWLPSVKRPAGRLAAAHMEALASRVAEALATLRPIAAEHVAQELRPSLLKLHIVARGGAFLEKASMEDLHSWLTDGPGPINDESDLPSSGHVNGKGRSSTDPVPTGDQLGMINVHAPGAALSGLVVGFRGIGKVIGERLEEEQQQQDEEQREEQEVTKSQILIEDLTDEELAEVLARRKRKAAAQRTDRMDSDLVEARLRQRIAELEEDQRSANGIRQQRRSPFLETLGQRSKRRHEEMEADLVEARLRQRIVEQEEDQRSANGIQQQRRSPFLEALGQSSKRRHEEMEAEDEGQDCGLEEEQHKKAASGFRSRLLAGIMNGGSLMTKQQEKMQGEMALAEAEDRIRRDGESQKFVEPRNEYERELNGVINEYTGILIRLERTRAFRSLSMERGESELAEVVTKERVLRCDLEGLRKKREVLKAMLRAVNMGQHSVAREMHSIYEEECLGIVVDPEVERITKKAKARAKDTEHLAALQVLAARDFSAPVVESRTRGQDYRNDTRGLDAGGSRGGDRGGGGRDRSGGKDRGAGMSSKQANHRQSWVSGSAYDASLGDVKAPDPKTFPTWDKMRLDAPNGGVVHTIQNCNFNCSMPGCGKRGHQLSECPAARNTVDGGVYVNWRWLYERNKCDAAGQPL